MSTFKEIRGQLIKSLSSDPSPVVNGDMWYNSTSQVLKGRLSTAAWSSGGNLSAASNALAGTGTLTAGVVAGGRDNPSDFDTTTENYKDRKSVV